MRIGIASDHGGFALKNEIAAKLRSSGHDVFDFGAHAPSGIDVGWRKYRRSTMNRGVEA
jgi:ribose 5-phosphate isomerase RpiB